MTAVKVFHIGSSAMPIASSMEEEQVAGRRHRDELGEALDQAEDDRLQDCEAVHEGSGIGRSVCWAELGTPFGAPGLQETCRRVLVQDVLTMPAGST